MLIVTASHTLTSTVCAVIALEMARELLRRRADLGSDVSVVFHLVRAGFGLPTIQKLRARATAAAKIMNARRRLN